MRKLGEGAEARVFETNMFGKPAIVKLRHAKAYRIKELDSALRRTRTRKEARAMQRAGDAGVRVPSLLGLGEFSIYMEKVSGKLLKDIGNKRIRYDELGVMLAKMHGANVIHGDFTPANIIANPEGLCIIDFGLADISDSIENKAIDLLLIKRSVSVPEYTKLQRAYSRHYDKSKQVIARLADIEKRGRYQIRSLA